MKSGRKAGFIGAGNMASAIIGGIVKKGLISGADMTVSNPSMPKLDRLRELYGVNITTDNREAARNAGDFLFLCVKPQFMQEVIEEIINDVPEDTVVISVAAGKPLSFLEEGFGRPLRLIRIMPNTPALVGEGCTAVSLGKEAAKPENADVVKESLELIESFGEAVVMPERLIDIAGQIGGASIAWLCLAMEGMADGAVAEGMPRDMAYKFAAAAMAGTGRLALSTGQHPGVLKDMVTSPAGTTIQGERILEERAVRGAFMDAVIESTERSRRM